MTPWFQPTGQNPRRKKRKTRHQNKKQNKKNNRQTTSYGFDFRFQTQSPKYCGKFTLSYTSTRETTRILSEDQRNARGEPNLTQLINPRQTPRGPEMRRIQHSTGHSSICSTRNGVLRRIFRVPTRIFRARSSKSQSASRAD